MRAVIGVRWLACTAEQVPAGDDWLAAPERAVQAGLRFERRRSSWRLGRWTAKQALLRQLEVDHPDRLTILAAQDGAPEAQLDGRPVPLVLTISHRGGLGVAALSTAAVGADLESVEPREASFLETFFTEPERAAAAAAPPEHRDRLVALMWSAKESALKLRRTGLRRDTRSMQVELPKVVEGAPWAILRVRDLEEPASWTGWWRPLAGLILTVVADGDGSPTELGASRGAKPNG